MELRRYREGDAEPARALFHRAVHEGAARAYDAQQREAWAPSGPRDDELKARWESRLAGQITWLAEEDGAVQGFLSLRQDGYLDLAFVAPERMGSGLAARLYDEVEAEARTLGLARLTTEASHLARPFFLKQGWQVDAEQQVSPRGVPLTNFRMSKTLA